MDVGLRVKQEIKQEKIEVKQETAMNVGFRVKQEIKQEIKEEDEVEWEEPEWLERLLRTVFFYICPRHCASADNKVNMFCLSCQGDGFCCLCRSSYHSGHPVIQIRMSSYHYAVRVSEIEKELDISDVQTYVINKGTVVFLNKRPHPKNNSSNAGASSNPKVSYFCEICSRTLLDKFRFCSLGCKVEGKEKRKKKKEEEEERLRKEREEEEAHKGTFRPNSRRRKGLPQRSPP